MKGDGNCGWRGNAETLQMKIVNLRCPAVAFGYFEDLFNLRDPMQVHRELVRIKSLSTLLDQVGQDENLYEIFVDATEEVFGSISGAIERGERDDSFLIELFNDEYNSNAIITHFRVSESFSPSLYCLYSFPLDLIIMFLRLTMVDVLNAAPNQCLDEIESPSLRCLPIYALRPVLFNANRDGQDRD